jgi:hypothetical protein
MAAEERFAPIAEALLREPDVTEGTGFGSNPGLRTGGHIFAMVLAGELVVKLPAGRCAALSGEDGVRPLEIGTRRMREWVSVADGPAHDWTARAREALAFVRG